MATYRTTFEAEVDVQFLEPDKSQAYYCQDGEFRNSFYRFDGLKDLARSIANHFQGMPRRWSPEHNSYAIFLEGYGEFVKQADGRFANTEECWDGGKILVWDELELEPTFTDLQEEQAA